jgi:ankyrin repeat protein
MPKDNDFIKNAQNIDQFLKRKLPSSVNNHIQTEQKTAGFSAGFVASSDDVQYMMKPGEMNLPTKDVPNLQKKKVKNLIKYDASEEAVKKEKKILKNMMQKVQDKGDMLREYMAPFNRVLYNNTASISIATDQNIKNFKGGQETPNKLYVRSEMISDFESLDSHMFYKIKASKDIENDVPAHGELLVGLRGRGVDEELVLKNDKGDIKEISISDKNIQDGIPKQYYDDLFNAHEKLTIDQEKALRKYAVNQFGYKNANIMSQAKGFEKTIAACAFLGDSDYHGANLGTAGGNIVKLDHGRAYYFNNDEYSYQGIDVDAEKLQSSINQITEISDKEIKALVRNRAYELKRMGFELDDSLGYYENNVIKPLAPISKNAITEKEKSDSRYKNMENNYINLYQKQKRALANFSKDLDVVIKMDMPDAWKKREWVHELNGDRPINWAIENQKTIQGIDPKIWGVLSGLRKDPKINIENIDPVLKFKFHLANKDFDKAKAEINNIRMISSHNESALKDVKALDRVEITELFERKIDQVNKNTESLFNAAKSGNVKEVERLIDESSANAKNAAGLSLMHVAAGSGNKELFDLLITKKADVNVEFKGTTALQLAVNKDHTEIAMIMINNGADASKVIQLATSKGQNEVVKLSIEKNANVDSQAQGNTRALRIAINKDNTELSEILIKAGANLDIKGEDGKSYIDLAIEKGQMKTIANLLDNGVDVNTKDDEHYTLLHNAIMNENKELIKLYTSRGADLEAKTHTGATPLKMATRTGNKEIVEMINDAIAEREVTKIGQVMRRASLSSIAITDTESTPATPVPMLNSKSPNNLVSSKSSSRSI